MNIFKKNNGFNDGIKVVKSAILLLFVEVGFFFVLQVNRWQNIYGVLFGGVVGLLFFRLIYLNITKVLDGKVKNMRGYIFINYIVRYIITGFILYIAAVSEYISLYTCFLGLLNIKIVIYLQNFCDIYLNRKK